MDEHASLKEIRHLLASRNWQIAAGESAQTSGDINAQLARFCARLHTRKIPVGDATSDPDTQNVNQELRSRLSWLLQLIESDEVALASQKIKYANLLGQELAATGHYALATTALEACLTANQAGKQSWSDHRLAFEVLMASVFCYGQLAERQKSIACLSRAESIQRQSPSVMHMRGWLFLQLGDRDDALLAYNQFLKKFDRRGVSPSLFRLIQRVRTEMAFVFFIGDLPEVAEEILKQVFERNPSGPDLDAFVANNQKYREEQRQFIGLINGVKNGGPFPLGRNQTQKGPDRQ